MRKARHHIDEHADELRIHLEAPSLPALFEEAARALAEAMGGGTAGPGDREAAGDPGETVTITARDRDALLVGWLNEEPIYRAETRGRIYTEARVERVDDRALQAVIRGRASRDGRTLVKAATFHGLHVEEEAGVFSASVLLDV